MRLTRPWKKYIGIIALDALLFYLVGPTILTMLGTLFSSQISILLVIMLALTILGAKSWFLFRSTLRGRFAAVTPKGVVVRNKTVLQSIAFEDISMFSKHDPVPWIKKKGVDRTLSLGNLFDSRSELAEFEQAIFRTGPNDSPPSQTDRNASNQEHSQDQDAPPGRREASGRSRKSRKRGPAAIMTAIGVSLIGIGLLSMPIVALLVSDDDLRKTIISMGVGVFWFGAAIALIGQWKSDRISRKKNKKT